MLDTKVADSDALDLGVWLVDKLIESLQGNESRILAVDGSVK